MSKILSPRQKKNMYESYRLIFDEAQNPQQTLRTFMKRADGNVETYEIILKAYKAPQRDNLIDIYDFGKRQMSSSQL